ncbi:sensor histidine kinase [Shivajiella indica]|uniref:Sensor histidine kinase n=1 Tax=Shivajiella indica TaxID=872115 RepID=A0ABW5BAI2_9BACT
MKKTKLNKNQTYWLLQLIGWISIILVETINYRFFILGRFDFNYFIQFIYLSFVGLWVTHFYKKAFIKESQFDRSISFLAIKGISDTIFISFIIIVLTDIPTILLNFDEFQANRNQFYIHFLGQIMNVCRYVVVWIIVYYLYHIMEKKSEIHEQKLLLETLAKSSELELLKSQLNPHFLFNALNSIKALVLIDAEKAREAIIKLSELLRFTLNYEKIKLISLSDEIDEVIKYLELEKIRFGNRLEVLIDLQEETLDAKVPPAMVLTLVENAIKHGITKLPDGGIIKIDSSINSKKIKIEVTNTGTIDSNDHKGIGMKNIRQRLQGLFGENTELILVSKVPNQVSATITYPLKYDHYE